MIGNRIRHSPVLLALLPVFAAAVAQPLSAGTDGESADEVATDGRIEHLREAIEREREALERERGTRRSMAEELDRMRDELERTREELERAREELEELGRETADQEAGAGD